MDFFGLIFVVFVFWLYYKLIKAVVKFIKKLPNIYLFEKKDTKKDFYPIRDMSYKPYSVKSYTNLKTEPINTFVEENYCKNIVSDISDFIKRDSLLSSKELNFFKELRLALAEKYDVYPQIHLGAIFRPKFKHRNWGPINRLNKRIDFLIVDKNSQIPLLGIELDDSTHEKNSRRKRDRFVEDLFIGNNIPFVRYNHGFYSCDELKKGLFKVLEEI